MNAQEVQTIRGYVQALPRMGLTGREDEPRVAVVTEDGTKYHVLHKGNGTSLVTNINADVEVQGYAGGPPATEPDAEEAAAVLFTVKSYRHIDGFDDPWYDDAVR